MDEAEVQLLFRRCHERIVGASTVQGGLLVAAPELKEFFPQIALTVAAFASDSMVVPDGFEDDFYRAISSAFVWGVTLGRELERGVPVRVPGDD